MVLHLLCALLVVVVVPGAFVRLLRSDDPRFSGDVVAGAGWYAFALAVVFVVAQLNADGWGSSTPPPTALDWVIFSPGIAAFWTVGVIRRHTPLADLMTPGGGIVGSLLSLDHPQSRLLRWTTIGGLAWVMPAAFLRPVVLGLAA